MSRKIYTYHHFVNNKEVTKEEFLKALEQVCMVCDTDYDNPLLNVCYVDQKKLKRKYNYYKTHPHHSDVYVYYKLQFKITREECKREIKMCTR